MILGIDISTSITGFAVVAEGEIVFYDSVDLRKYKNLFEKAERIKEAIFNIFDKISDSSTDVVPTRTGWPLLCNSLTLLIIALYFSPFDRKI